MLLTLYIFTLENPDELRAFMSEEENNEVENDRLYVSFILFPNLRSTVNLHLNEPLFFATPLPLTIFVEDGGRKMQNRQE